MRCHKCNSNKTIAYKSVPRGYEITEDDRQAILSNQYHIIEYNPYEAYLYECIECGFIAKEYSTLFPKDYKNIIEYIDFLLSNTCIKQDDKNTIIESILERFEGKRITIKRPVLLDIEKARMKYIEIRPHCKTDKEAYERIANELGCSSEYLKKELVNFKII